MRSPAIAARNASARTRSATTTSTPSPTTTRGWRTASCAPTKRPPRRPRFSSVPGWFAAAPTTASGLGPAGGGDLHQQPLFGRSKCTAKSGIGHIVTVPNTPRWNGQVECFNETMECRTGGAPARPQQLRPKPRIATLATPLQRAQTRQLTRLRHRRAARTTSQGTASPQSARRKDVTTIGSASVRRQPGRPEQQRDLVAAAGVERAVARQPLLEGPPCRRSPR